MRKKNLIMQCTINPYLHDKFRNLLGTLDNPELDLRFDLDITN